MAVAALVLSIVAVLVSAASAWYTRRQATATEHTRAIEADRRHDELTPSLDARYVPAEETRDRARPGVRLTNRRPLDLDRIEIETVPAHRAHEAVVKGIYDPRTGDTAPGQETGRMRLAESWTFDVIPLHDDDGRERGGTLTLRCRCYAVGHDPWRVTVDVEFPAEPMVF